MITVKDFFNSKTDYYLKYSNYWASNEAINKMSILMLKSLRGNVVIDFGSGTGILLKIIHNFKTKIAVDISEKMLSLISDESIIKINKDIHDINFPNSFADLVICRQVLHYCDLDKVFDNIYIQLCRKGAVHIVQIIDYEDIPNIWFEHWINFRNIKNRKHLNKTIIDSKINAHGYNINSFQTLELDYKYTWKDFFIKNLIKEENETEVIKFFNETDDAIKNSLCLHTNDTHIQYRRKFGFWLLKND